MSTRQQDDRARSNSEEKDFHDVRNDIHRDVKKWNENVQKLKGSEVKIQKYLVDHSSFYSDPHKMNQEQKKLGMKITKNN